MRIGILGAGTTGKLHALAYQAMPGVDVAAIYGQSLTNAGPLAQRVGVVATTDFGSLLEDPAIEAIDVCVPSAVHRGFVVAALDAGKHVFCETPLALGLDDASAMIDAARRSGRLLLVALLMRSVAEYQHIKRAVAAGEIGRPLSLRTYRWGSYLRTESPEFRAHYGDPTTELMTFDFDVIIWLVGLPRDACAVAATAPDGRPGHVFALLRWDDGMIAEAEASGIMPPSFPFSAGLRVVGGDGVLDLSTTIVGDVPETRLIAHGRSSTEIHVAEEPDPYQAECRYFIECVRGRADPEFLSAARALEALRLSVAVQHSIRHGQSVTIS
ncbi:MAG: hypothetical protein GEU73_11215 [Chloroflexi bacterium]|nr:hypothetical protein [Chloroflexota bacterium]